MLSKFYRAFFSVILLCGLGTSALAYQTKPQADIYVVMFRADWCAPCKVVEPRLQQVLASIRDPKIEFLELDFSANNGDWNANAVFDRQIVPQYNKWLGVTGFAAIIDADSKKTLGCVTQAYNADAMEMHIKTLQKMAKNNQANTDFTCPEANN
ncbi:thioredoxin [Litorimonas taeanensis]|uniref:Thioredoxin n=1 Tax=Litorimonas taeanensis TaxID=568099 RepID=A0A420WKG5_9PROT|nr:thioredoxin family protein [Litorimonas taeanensis]RKQ71484.1 thioredoxin [Litorimonas taeanensis]